MINTSNTSILIIFLIKLITQKDSVFLQDLIINFNFSIHIMKLFFSYIYLYIYILIEINFGASYSWGP